ncbi:ExbD/TolR family protein [Porphyromonas pogonae]|uniref:ExbD/TolR family protein n=1 Tax=Porphyromonas pogonae TaxID=867595 RepID=UPI002E77F996|nr:biopolymer transporter ExbD [Porphyromonas pogonae]
MGKFSKAGGREMPELNTSSLPDLVFAFLFFIMMVTTIREVTAKVSYNNLPNATELTKLEEKSLVTFIYIGPPTEAYQAMYGTKPCIQINEQITQDPKAVYSYVKGEQGKIKDERKKLMTVSLKVDKNTRMKIVSDVKEELRRADALNISYSAREDRRKTEE